jgi:hypothetical protein
MFWRINHLQGPVRAAHRALDLARAALLLGPSPEEPREPVGPRACHPHRTRLRARSARRRGGSVPARPQHCITPLVRTAGDRRAPARRD